MAKAAKAKKSPSKNGNSTHGGSVLVGAGCVVINPPLGAALVGYPKGRPNAGVGLDLCARAVAFAAPGAKAPQGALVVIDTIGVWADIVARIRRKAAQLVSGLAGETLLVAATHTHSAPTLHSWRKGGKVVEAADEKYVQQVVDGAAAAVAAAWGAARPATIRVSSTEAFLGHNRRALDAAGKAHAEWLDPDGRHTGYFNPIVPFVAFDDAATGKVHAMIVSYWCHPVTLGPPNTIASPDYPGYFVRKLEKDTGAAVVLHLTGGGANINPRQALFDNPAHAERMGLELAGKVLAALPSAGRCAAGRVRSVSVALKLLVAKPDDENLAGRVEDSPAGKTLTTEVQALAVGDLAFVTAPGELFAEIGTGMLKASPFPHTIVVGYADDYLGYLFTDQAKAEGGYEPSNPVSEQIEQPLLAAAKEAMNKALGK